MSFNALLHALQHAGANTLADAGQMRRLLLAVSDGLTLAQVRQAESEFNVENIG